eukprot:GHVQ01030303.1.p1 GENE.GHVQ01030303.1~~GHVQ01030303.1.p1  ORF type:complete len:507 (-),score=166.94 GHVQ01030303.1:230-1567(-)
MPRPSQSSFDSTTERLSHIHELARANTSVGVNDCCWSEASEHVLATAMADGRVNIYDIRHFQSTGGGGGVGGSAGVCEGEGSMRGALVGVGVGHGADVCSLSWNDTMRNAMLSSSLDGSVRMWDVSGECVCVRVWRDVSYGGGTGRNGGGGGGGIGNRDNGSAVYKAVWSPTEPSWFVSVGSDGLSKVYDIRLPTVSHHHTSATQSNPVLCPSPPSTTAAPVSPVCVAASLPSSSQAALSWRSSSTGGEVLSVDWNKYNNYNLITGTSDGLISYWDIRTLKPTTAGPSSSSSSAQGTHHHDGGGGNVMAPTAAVACVKGHRLSVRDIKSSPFRADSFLSASYDMTVSLWVLDPTTTHTHPTHTHPTHTHSSTLWTVGGAWHQQEKSMGGNVGGGMGGGGGMRCVCRYDRHREFVMGVDWNIFYENVVASTSWDKSTNVWTLPSRW